MPDDFRAVLVAIVAMVALTVALPAAAASAADDDDGADRARTSAGTLGKQVREEETETENVFGFTEGADTGEAGEREISYQLTGRRRRGSNGYSAADNIVGSEAVIEVTANSAAMRQRGTKSSPLMRRDQFTNGTGRSASKGQLDINTARRSWIRTAETRGL